MLLCCLMMGWPGRAQSQVRLFPAPSSLAAQAATVPLPSKRLDEERFQADALQKMQRNQPKHQETQAAFERLHITHARINVPN